MFLIVCPFLFVPFRRRLGPPQFFVSLAAFLLLLAVAVCLVFSKLALLSLVSTLSWGLQPSVSDERSSHVALAMILLAVVLPHVCALLVGLWNWCYRSRTNNPNPSLYAALATVAFVVLETAGIALLLFVIAPRISSAESLVAMQMVFAGVTFAWMRQRDRPIEDMDPVLPPLHVPRGTSGRVHPRPHAFGLGLERGRAEKRSSVLGFVIQLLLVLGFPVYLYFFAHAPIWTCVLVLVSVLLIGLAWVPQLQE